MRSSIFISALVAMFLTSCVQSKVQTEPLRDQKSQGFDIIRHDVSLKVQFDSPVIEGVQRIELWVSSNSTELDFDMGEISITRLRLAGREVMSGWHYDDGNLKIPLPRGLDTLMPLTLEVSYQAEPKRGFRLDPKVVYTGYFACDWMICNQQDFNDRAMITLKLTTPSGLTSVGPGELVDVSSGEEGHQVHTWKTQDSFPAYTYAFAVGEFDKYEDATCSRSIITLSFRSQAEIRGLFEASCEMMEFFQAKAGTPNGSNPYYQIMVEDSGTAQEAVSHAILGTKVVLPQLEDLPKTGRLLMKWLINGGATGLPLKTCRNFG